MRWMLGLGVVALTATLASADTVLTNPPVIHKVGDGLTCVAVNVRSQTLFMKADVMELFGNSPLDSAQDDAAPGFPLSSSGDGNFCRFTVQKKSGVRAAAQVRTAAGDTLAVIPAQWRRRHQTRAARPSRPLVTARRRR